MSDLTQYINRRKNRDAVFAKDFDSGYEDFKIGVQLRSAREKAGLTQEQLAQKLKTRKSAISRIENHAADIRLSTLERFAEAIGRRLHIALGR